MTGRSRLLGVALVGFIVLGAAGCATSGGASSREGMAGASGGCAFAVPSCFKEGRTR